MKNSKKGFTLVELLVVIAIVAILATVAIIGYTSFTRKADISNDTVIAGELNTLLAATDATDPIESFDDVKAALYANGFYLANLNTKTDGCYFVWDSANNQIILVDGNDGFKVLYSKVTPSANKADWKFVVSDIEKATAIEAAGYSVERIVTDLGTLKEALAAGGEFHIDESLVLTSEGNVNIKNNDSEVVLNLGDSVLSTDGTISTKPVNIENAKVTIKGGVFNATGLGTSEFGTFACAIGYSAGTKLTVENAKFECTTAINGTYDSDGYVELVVSNSILKVSNNGVILSTGHGTGSKATINNCTITAGAYAIFASQGGTITVNEGTYKGETAVIYSQDTDTKVVVNNGTFDGKFDVGNGGSIVINAGTFSNTGLTLEEFSAYVADGKTVTEDNGTFIVK